MNNLQKDNWNKVKKLLREAQSELLPDSIVNQPLVPNGVLTGTMQEFEEFLLHNELELAWETLTTIGKKQIVSSLFSEKMKLAALEMKLLNIK